MKPYMTSVLSDLRQRWLPLLGRNQAPSAADRGETRITVSIDAAGHLAAMHMDESSHVDAIDGAAWTATKETSFLPLPPQMKLANLKLSLHFDSNPQVADR